MRVRCSAYNAMKKDARKAIKDWPGLMEELYATISPRIICERENGRLNVLFPPDLAHVPRILQIFREAYETAQVAKK